MVVDPPSVGSRDETPATAALVDALADPTRREVLRILADRPAPINEPDLARRVEDELDRSAEEPVQLALRHRHLPVLAEAGLVEFDDRCRRTEWGDVPVVALANAIDRLSNHEWRLLAAILREDRLRTTVSVLADRGSETTDVLARVVADRERDGTPPERLVASVRSELVHVHLPRLAEMGVVDFESDRGRVVFDPDVPLREDWLRPGLSLEAALLDGPEPEGAPA